MHLDQASRMALHGALLDAFPNGADLELVVNLGLGQNIADIVPPGTTRPLQMLKLIQWAESADKVPDFVRAAVAAQPTNGRLQAVAAPLGVAAADPAPAPGSAGTREAVVTGPAAPPPPPLGPIRQRWALLIGIDHYVNPGFATLHFCVKDVQALETTLQALGYTVKTLYDGAPDPVRDPTRANIEEALATICAVAGRDDLVWVHFACHGTLIDGKPVLVARDTGRASISSTGLPLAQVEASLRGSAARRLVLSLDACHTGVETGRDVTDPAFIQNVFERAEGFALIAASTAQQVAQEWQAVQHGVFTYYLLEALSGQADHDHKGFVTVHDVVIYVLDALRRWAFAHNGLIQDPNARTEGLGDMILGQYATLPAAAGS